MYYGWAHKYIWRCFWMGMLESLWLDWVIKLKCYKRTEDSKTSWRARLKEALCFIDLYRYGDEPRWLKVLPLVGRSKAGWYGKEENLKPNDSSDIRCSDHLPASIALEQNLWVMSHDKRHEVSFRDSPEWASSEGFRQKLTQATQMMPTPIMEEEKPEKILRDRLNESTGQQIPKKRMSNSMKVEQMRRRAKAPVELMPRFWREEIDPIKRMPRPSKSEGKSRNHQFWR